MAKSPCGSCAVAAVDVVREISEAEGLVMDKATKKSSVRILEDPQLLALLARNVHKKRGLLTDALQEPPDASSLSCLVGQGHFSCVDQMVHPGQRLQMSKVDLLAA